MCRLACGCIAFMLCSSWISTRADEPEVKPADPAAALAQQGQKAYEAGKLDVALALYRRVCGEHAKSSSYGIAQYNMGLILEKQKKYDEAIAEYTRLLASQVSDRDPGSHIMEAYRSYRNHAAKGISRCHEAKGDVEAALRWYVLSRDKYHYQTWCGTCRMQEAAATAAEVVRLTLKTGKTDEALGMAEPMLFDMDMDGNCRNEVAFLVVDVYHQRGQLDALSQRLEEMRKRNLAAFKKSYPQLAAEPNNKFDGNSPAMLAAAQSIEIRRLADKEDTAGLWKLVLSRSGDYRGAMDWYSGSFADNWKLRRALAALSDMPEAAVPFLKGKLEKPSVEQGWAYVVLAKMQIKDIVPQLAESIADGNGRATDADDALRWLLQDYFYALWLLDRKAADAQLDKYAASKQFIVSDAAKNFRFRLQYMKDVGGQGMP